MKTYDRVFGIIKPKINQRSPYWEHISSMKQLTKMVKEQLLKATHD